MKKKIVIILSLIVGLLLLALVILYAVDINRMKNNKEVVFSTWGYKYGPPVYKTTENNDIVSIKYFDNEFKEKEVNITDKEDIEILKEIFCNVKYKREPCNGIYTHTITINNEKYYLLEDCKEINHNGKQALISDKNIDKINSMIGK